MIRKGVWNGAFTALCCLAAVAYPLGLAWFMASRRSEFLLDPSVLIMNLAMVGLLVGASCYFQGHGWGELGVEPGRLGRSALAGLITGVAMAAPAIAVVRMLAPSSAAPKAGLDRLTLGLLVLAHAGLGTALVEEVIFRGLLYHQLLGALGTAPRAVLASSGLFAAWHVGFVGLNVGRLPPEVPAPPLVLAAGAVVAAFFGGLWFGYLRWRTGSLAAPLVAHWVLAAALMAMPRLA